MQNVRIMQLISAHFGAKNRLARFAFLEGFDGDDSALIDH